jgi:hypothetical protein
MELFNDDLQKNNLKATRQQDWYTTNKLDGKAYPVLRQPIHQGYYLVNSEISCDNRGRSPVDPKRISEAWMLVTPYEVKPEVKTPNSRQAIQLFQALLLRAKQQGCAYPLRPVVSHDLKGVKHTLLCGFLPVADIVHNINRNDQLIDTDQVNASASEMADSFADASFTLQSDQVLWNGTTAYSRLNQLMQLLDENLAIGIVEGELAYTAVVTVDADSGVAIQQWQNWLQQAYFYQVPEQTHSQQLNVEQQQFKVRKNQLAASLHAGPPALVTQAYRDAYSAFRQTFLTESVPSLTPRTLSFNTRYDFTAERIADYTRPWIDYLSRLSVLLVNLRSQMLKPENMLAGLSDLRLSIETFKTRLDSTRIAAQALDRQFQPGNKYRTKNMLQWMISDRTFEDRALNEQLPHNQKLIVPADWVRQGPDLIRRRWTMLVNSFTREWQATGQTEALTGDDEQLYQIRVLAKVTADNGCEYMAQSQLSEPFYIASFYETRLMPSYPIKMPTLKDLKKAISGPAMVMPSDLAKEVNKLKFPDGKVEQSASGRAGRWIYVFSIPIVTICAMILLMLIINILNFIFRWIPFAILRIPFPK